MHLDTWDTFRSHSGATEMYLFTYVNDARRLNNNQSGVAIYLKWLTPKYHMTDVAILNEERRMEFLRIVVDGRFWRQ